MIPRPATVPLPEVLVAQVAHSFVLLDREAIGEAMDQLVDICFGWYLKQHPGASREDAAAWTRLLADAVLARFEMIAGDGICGTA